MNTHTSRSWHSGRPYSPAASSGEWVYVSGQVPVRADGSTAGEDAGEQVAQVLQNVRAALEAAGSRMSDVVSTQVFLTDITDIDAVDAAYRDTFPEGAYPSRTTVEISRLGRPEFRVEISAVAHHVPGD
ncbi:RidA family protein [Georgenia alba]|uniref:RidA family protein n=1 Tax=Georgenia alba TaxID=2233858 RepID=A0ABW2Q8V2_9MICO